VAHALAHGPALPAMPASLLARSGPSCSRSLRRIEASSRSLPRIEPPPAAARSGGQVPSCAAEEPMHPRLLLLIPRPGQPPRLAASTAGGGRAPAPTNAASLRASPESRPATAPRAASSAAGPPLARAAGVVGGVGEREGRKGRPG
jgi:hypothetical protein